MKRHLRLLYSDVSARLLWSVLAFLATMLRPVFGALGIRQSSFQRMQTGRLVLASGRSVRQVVLAIGMLMAGWLGATQAQAQSPGGVSSGLQTWLKADAGTSSSINGAALTSWNDLSGNARNHTQSTAIFQPKYKTNAFNFNPAVTFDGLDVMIANAFASGREAVHVFAMAKVGDSGWRSIYGFGRDVTHVQWLSTLPSVWTSGNYYSSSALGTDYGVTSYILPKDGSQRTIHWNGASSNIAGTNNYPYNASKMGVGSDVSTDGGGLSENFLGDIAEVVIYKTGTPSTNGGRMTTLDIEKVESYLGLKYGVTLSHNYLSSAGATVYSVASYSANITGIGRDDAGGLNQKQSKSIDAKGLVTIGNGAGIAATNVLNSNSFAADASFEIIGDNGLADSYATAYLPNVYVSPVPSAFRLMSRIWKVQETGTVGTVTISVPATTKAEILVVSNSATFTPGVATEITLTPDGNGNLTAQVNLTDGQFFTFGSTVVAPGGVTADIQVWVKADNGIVANGAAVNQWTDQSPENHNLVQATAANQPLLQGASTFFNFNPSVKFDGAGDRLAYKLTRFMSTTSPGTFYGAASNATNGGYENLGDLGIDNPHMGTLGNEQIMWMNGSAPVRIDHPTVLTRDKPTLLGYFWNGGGPDVGSGLRQNGSEYNVANTEATLVGNGGPSDGQFQLGSYEGVENWNGHIAEAFLYSRNLSAQEKDRVDTYLAVKYGTTLTHNYLASDGATIYNVSSYSTNITGIGRDNASGLHQKQSKSINARSILTIGLGTALAATNAANANSFPVNNSFEIVGDDGRPYSYSASYAPTSFTPAGGAGFFRMAATWRVQETGTVGTVVIGAASSTGADYLLVSNAATFIPASTTEIMLTSDGNGNMVASVDLTNGQFFTFGSAEKAPGGILAGLRMWLKANDLSGNDGDQVTIWPSSVLSVPFSVSQVTAAQRPTLAASTTDLINFNQTVNFRRAAVQDLTNSSQNLLSGLTPSFHFIAVGKDMDPATVGAPWFGSGNVRALLGNGLGSNNPAMDMFKDLATATGFRPYSSDDGWWGGGRETIYNNGGTNRLTSQATHPASVQTRIANQQPQIFGIGFTWGAPSNALGTLSTSFMNAWVDGYKEITDINHRNSYLVPTTPALTVGSSGGEFWNGNISEVINYNRELSDAEMAKVNTYLAIKYGTTLGQGGTSTALVGSNVNSYSYVATDGTVVWNPTSNAGYNYDIAGIGLDNFEGLNQKQSKSVNAGFQPALGLGVVAASNEANNSSFAADKSYMVWGSNGLGMTYAVSYTPSFTSPAPYYTMPRIWKVQETNTVGVVTVSIPGSSPNTLLLVSNGTNFATSSGVTEYTMVSDGNGNMTAQVNYTTGQYFTFALPVYSPGCVAGGPALWLKGDAGLVLSGTAVTGWQDQGYSGATLIQNAAVNQPTYTGTSLTNFNPAVTFDNTGTQQWLRWAPNGGSGLIDRSNGALYSVAKLTSSANALLSGWDDDGNDPAIGITAGNIPFFYTQNSAIRNSGFTIANNAPFFFGTSWQNDMTGNNASNLITPELRFNGQSAVSLSVYNAYVPALTVGVGARGTAVEDVFRIGRDTDYGGITGDVLETIVFENPLTAPERQRLESYFGIKYGMTLPFNYLSGGGATIYDVSSFSANITGIGRDDCQQLMQKQSRSVNPGARMTISISNTVASSNATNTGSFTASNTFITFGDNNLTGTAPISQTGSCPPPPSVDRVTNIAYKVTETGSAGPALIQELVTGFGFNLNFPVYMQVYSDAAMTNLLASVPMSYTNSIGTALYDFPGNATSYVRFAGNTTAPANMCVAPKAQTFHWNGWWYGTKQKVLLPNYIPQSNSATAAMTMSVSVTDGGNNNLLYKPAVDWWPVFDGYGLFIPRNDNNSTSGLLAETNTITTRMQFRQGTSTSVVAANTVDFMVYDVDGWYWSRDLVKIYGKQGASTITPKLTQFKPAVGWDPLVLNTATGQATGGFYPWDLSVYGRVYVSFDTPVEEVFVEYTKDNRYSFNVYNDMRIGPVTVTCLPPKPKEPLADNVYVYKEVSPNPQKTDEEVTYKFTIQNTNCGNKTINLTDNLPSGLTWIDSTFVASTSLTVGSVNGYGNLSSLILSNVTVPPGTHYFYAGVKGQIAGVYMNQASYVVTNGTGATYLSDDPGSEGTTAQPTPLTLIDNDPDANLIVEKTVNNATAPQNGTLTYTYTITNPNASSAVMTTFNDVLPGELTYVGSSLSGLSGGYVSSTAVTPYSGSSVLTMRDLNVPAGSSLTFTIQANTNSYTVGAVANNIAQVTPDINSGFRIKAFNSSAASTTITQPPTVTITGPLNTTTALNPTVSGTATPGAQVVLTSSSGGTLCTTTATAGGTWSCPVNLTAGPQTLSAVATNSSGVSTPATTQITATAAPIQVVNPPALTATPGTSNTGNAATELAPSGGTTPYSYSNDTGNPSCSAVAGATALPNSSLTVNSSTGAYSYTAPAAPGVYYFCIKVCDATPTCVTKTYTLTVTAPAGTGTLDCSTAQISGIVAGTPGNGVLKLSINVTQAGQMPVTVTGSGLATSPNPYMINPSATGVQTFYVPLTYSGAAFAAGTVISVTGAGTCTVDMTAVTPKTVSTSVLNLGPACSPATAATLVK